MKASTIHLILDNPKRIACGAKRGIGYGLSEKKLIKESLQPCRKCLNYIIRKEDNKKG